MYFDARKPGKELDATAASAADDRLEEILRKLKAAGGQITKDEIIPLHVDFNMEVVEIGEQRTVEFNLNKTDFQIVRNVKNVRVAGASHRKHLENLDRPMIETKLKRKPQNSDQWIGVDLEDLF